MSNNPSSASNQLAEYRQRQMSLRSTRSNQASEDHPAAAQPERSTFEQTTTINNSNDAPYVDNA